jgi:hypothetical protein
MHTPSFWQGWESQGSATSLHVLPVHPMAQLQLKLFTPSLQVPPFWHGFELQSSMLVSQVVPL